MIRIIDVIQPRIINLCIKNRLTRLCNALNKVLSDDPSASKKTNIAQMQPKSKNIIKWNLNGFYKNIDEIKIIIHLHQPIALCLQETNLKSDDPSPNL